MKSIPQQEITSNLIGKHLDLVDAKKLRSLTTTANEERCSILDLSTFVDMNLPAIKYLSRYPYNFVILGIKELNPNIADLLGKWMGEPCLVFEQLITLDEECARALCKSPINLDLIGMRPLSVEIAKELVKVQGNLALSFDFISLEIAKILKEHQYTLLLTLEREPSYDAAIELGQHQGHELLIYRMPTKPSDAFLDALSLSQTKIVTYDQVAFPFFSIELRNKD